jgi:hypothetical protein
VSELVKERMCPCCRRWVAPEKANSEKNKGRVYFSCQECQWFEWHDATYYRCAKCDKSLQELTVKKEGKNIGRKFTSCPNCKIFRWIK